MIEEKVVVSKKRDFSDVLNVSFAFIRQEYKGIVRMLFIYAGIPVLVLGILSALYVDNTLTDIINNALNPELAEEFVEQAPGKALLVNLINLVVQVFLTGLTYCYVALYKEKGADNFELNEVWNKFSSLFLTFIGYNILTGIVVILALIALIIPAIYVSVPLSLILIVRVMEDKGYGDSFSRTFALVKDHWWETFGLIIVTAIIVMTVSGLFGIPAGAIGIAKGILQEEFTISSIPIILTTLVSTIGTALITPLSPLVVSFQYFSLVEHKDNTSLLDKIDKINEAPNSEDE